MKQSLTQALQQHLRGEPLVVHESQRLLWGWFVNLARTRSYHLAGPNPISYSEIEAFARLYRWPLEPRHVETIRALDDIWLEHARNAATLTRGASSSNLPAPGRGQKLNAANFDAVFG